MTAVPSTGPGNEQTAAVCDSRGPRVGSEGCPRCRQPKGHDGPHRPAPDDGWGDMTWSDPVTTTAVQHVPLDARSVLTAIDDLHERAWCARWTEVDDLATAFGYRGDLTDGEAAGAFIKARLRELFR